MPTRNQKSAVATQTGDFLLYQTDDGKTRIEVRMQGETVWLSQKQMAELFQKDVRKLLRRTVKEPTQVERDFLEAVKAIGSMEKGQKTL